MEEKIEQLENEIRTIKDRNVRVEADKAWETSNMRIGSIMMVTYIVAAIVMYTIGVKNYLLSALVPVVGFYLSTQSLPAIKRYWMRKYLPKK